MPEPLRRRRLLLLLCMLPTYFLRQGKARNIFSTALNVGGGRREGRTRENGLGWWVCGGVCGGGAGGGVA